ncbi:MAG: hypothetical protein AAFO58_06025, partial [Pseudomonadota bacterium]
MARAFALRNLVFVVRKLQVARGRPGWHIECSAMAADLLGPEFD